MISVTINNRTRQFEREMSLPELLQQLAIAFPRIAVAHNGEVLRQDEHAALLVRDGDALEIVRMVGGGADEFRVPGSGFRANRPLSTHAQHTTWMVERV